MTDENFQLPPPTAPASIPMSMRGFASSDDAHRLANKIAGLARLISSHIDLSRLDGITVAYDYDDALAQLDRGKEGLRTLTRSNDDNLIGVGMSPSVLRDGHVKVHIVLNGAYVEDLDNDEEPTPEFLQSLYLLAHECAHVQVTADMDNAFPGTILQQQVSDYEAAIYSQVNDSCWDEYAACRLSAIFGKEQLRHYEEGLRNVLAVARPRAREARLAFWDHRDLNRVVAEMGPHLMQPLRMAAYVYGHLDGGPEGQDIRQETKDAIAAAGYSDLVDELVTKLRDLWARSGQWSSRSEFDVIGDVGRELMWSEGLHIEANNDDDGAFIRVWEPSSEEDAPQNVD